MGWSKTAMADSKQKTWSMIGLPLLAVFATLALVVASACVIDALPRSMQGEAVIAPWPACLVGSIAASSLFPWLVSLPVLRRYRTRVYFLACVAVSNAILYPIFGVHMLTEAYLRGL